MQALQIDHHGPVSALTVRDVPRILGHDFAGRVCEGPADLIGQDVWGSGGELGIWRHGTHAEYLALPRDGVAPRPRALSVEAAAAVGVPFLTAWAALMDRDRLQAGEWVIIAGAAGAVGSLFQPLLDVMAAEGRMVCFSAMDGRDVPLDLVAFYRNNLTLHGLNTAVSTVVRDATMLNQLAPLFASGALTPPRLAARYPLPQAAEAYQRVASGKVVLIPDRLYDK
jgi:NADPH:quinone reductase-like Zn-dependent oxidoreductase